MWEKVKIKDIVSGFFDGPHATPEETSEGPIFLGIKNITPDGRIDLSDTKHLSENDFVRWTKRVTPRENDIVFTYEATLHRYALIPKGLKCCLGRRLALLRIDEEKAHYKFVHYWMLGEAWRTLIEGKIITGATVDRIPLVEFPDFTIPLPPLNIQHQIAAVLGRYDELLENYKEQVTTLEGLAHELYQEWFVRGRCPKAGVDSVGELPTGWARVKFTDVISVQSGGTPKTSEPNYWDGEVYWFSPGDVDTSYYVLTTDKTITEEGLKNCNSKLYPVDTVVITARGTVGKCVMLGRPMSINQSNYALVGCSVSQYFTFFKTLEMAEGLQKEANGAVFSTITTDNFERADIVLPDADSLAAFDKLVAPMFGAIKNCLEQSEILRATRDGLLTRLLSGQLLPSSIPAID